MLAAGFLFATIRDAGRCGAWLRELLPHITRGAQDPKDFGQGCLNVAFTRHGLAALGLRDEELRTFSFEFQQGMAARARDLGDTGEHGPEHWQVGGRAEHLHLLLMVYARGPKELEEQLAGHRAGLERAGLEEVYCQKGERHRDAGGSFVDHFGFRDALSQPAIEGLTDLGKHGPDYDRPLKAGELLLGHADEFGEVPDPPSVPGERDADDLLPDHGHPPGWKALGHNGTYLVVRKLRQDVAAFEQFIAQHAGDNEELATLLKAKMVGRWPNGSPLRPGQERQPERGLHETVDNSFRYMREDPHGYGCPLGSHVRRSNPRDSLAPNPKLSMKIGRYHRIVRRGIPYVDPDGTRGLMFMALNTDLARQFEFIQRTWMNNEQMAGLDGDVDPLTKEQSQRERRVILQEQPVRKCLGGLSEFVRMRGGGYFFLPGLRALEWLADQATRD
jgi:Dyp-type peroxidase family